MQNSHVLTEKEVVKNLKSSMQGLDSSEAQSRLSKYGKNEILEKKKSNPLLIFLKQFHSWLIYILILAAIISYFFGHLIDVYVIVAVILINAIIGFVQEYKAEKSIRALKKLVVSYAKVHRNKNLTRINATDLVPGDVISLEEGDRVPADCRLLEIKRFRTNEASLTGESFPVDKELKTLPEGTQIADQRNMVFMGTFVASGSAVAIVVATGNETSVGKLAKDIQQIKTGKSHFKQKSDTLAKQMGFFAIGGSIIIFILGYFVKELEFSEIFIFTIASLVSGIPEGLPAVLAIVLAIGAFRMSRKNALIRQLPATETLGVVTTIITDKTGTLTKNTMNIETVALPNEQEVNVSGEGWIPDGKFSQADKIINPLENSQLSKLLYIATICNNSKLIVEKNKHSIIGDPTEAALVVLGAKAGLKKDTLIKNRLDDIPFNPELKYRASLSTLVKDKNKKQLYVVGAPEAVLLKTSKILSKNVEKEIDSKDVQEINSQINKLTKKGNRVLALAYADLPKGVNSLSESLVKELVFVGLVGIRDPPRPEVKEAIARAKRAGIRVIMATGDHKQTALAIAKDIGLADSKSQVITGVELEKLSKREFSKTVRERVVFARLTPNMKLKIAEELQKQKQIVAMTGDGVNDAPALKKADIGIAMGVIGTDVARESSDVVLADDNFASIVNAVEEGRIVFTNTRNASSFLITTNVAEDITIIAALAIGLPLPLLPTQLLWLNLVTDGVTDVSLAAEPGHNDALSHPPRSAKENILSKQTIPFIILMSVVMVFATFYIFYNYLPEGLDKARTGAFAIMSFTQFFNLLNMRSMEKSVFKIGFFSNKYVIAALIVSIALSLLVMYLPFLQNIFQFVSLSLGEIGLIIAISSLVLIAGEAYKFFKK